MLVPIANTPRDYAWGSRSFIAQLEGREPSGRPEAEVWFGDHPGSPARVPGGGTLDAVLRDLGHARLPYLLKLLAAESPLSIQVHPTKIQAEAGYRAEAHLPADAPERNYQDDNHKPEMIVALSDTFLALCGLRPVSDTVRYLTALGDAPQITVLRDALTADADETAALRSTIAWLLSGAAHETVNAVIAAVSDAASAEFADELTAARRIAAVYPGDPGVVVAMLMNLVTLRRGEAISLRAGLLHAYLHGLGVEIMAASDNVLRGGLTAKRVDVPELMKLTDTAPGPVTIRDAAPVPEASGLVSYGSDVADFALARATLQQNHADFTVADATTFLATRGSIDVTVGEDTVTLRPGNAAIYLGSSQHVRVSGPGEVFVASPGIDNA